MPYRSLLLALPLLACQAPMNTPQQVLAGIRADLSGDGGLDQNVLKEQEGRYDLLREWRTAGRLTSAEDQLYAAAALVTSDRQADLRLAQELALEAAAQDEARGFTIQAEATDKLLLKAGRPQRYGTQFVYEPVLKRWKLYALDPLTTDEERKAMGIPPLSVLLERVDLLNANLSTRELLQEAVLGPSEPPKN